MKKILSVAAIAALITTAASADGILNVHGGTATILNESVNTIGIGIGGGKTWESGMNLGMEVNLDYAKTKVDPTYTVETNFKLGYKLPVLNQAINLYGIGGVAAQATNNLTWIGFGYGAGLDYQFADSWLVGVEYKKYSLTEEKGVVSYDYDTTTAKIAYTF